MIPFKYFLLGIIVVLLFTIYSSTADNVENHHARYHHVSMFSFVVSKGCTYLSGFVESVYARSHNSKDVSCDWQSWVTTRCSALHMPTEICHGLMSCGQTCAMSALRAPADMMHACNVSSLSAIVGKRSHVDYSSLHVCSNSPEGSHIGFGRRDADVSDSVGHHSTSANDNHGHLSVSALSLRRWCSKFSKYIRSKYHFNEVKFVRSSYYWLVDVYKIGPKFGVPLKHTHGLVGCGMEYALNALNAPSWLSVFYKLADK